MKKVFRLHLESLKLRNHEDHIATRWQVSTTKNYSDIICDSGVDKINKLSKTFRYENVIPGKKYWSRCKVLLSTGWTEWSNFDVCIPKTINDIPGREFLPSVIASPCVYTDSVADAHLPIGFNIKVKDFGAKGDSTHLATSYFIEKLSGEVVWKRLYDRIQKYHYHVNDIMLKPDTIYRVRAVFHSSSYDASVVSTKTILVADKSKDVNILRLTEQLKKINFETKKDIYSEFVKHEGVDTVEISIYSYSDGSSEFVYGDKITLTNRLTGFNIPVAYFKEKQIYVLYLKYNNKEEKLYNIFNTY